MSDWLGVDVDCSSDPVLAPAGTDQRITTRDNLLDARARHASARLGLVSQGRPNSGGSADERKARPRNYGHKHRSTLRSRG